MVRNVGVTEALVESIPEWAQELFAVLTLLGDWLVVVAVLGVLYLADVGASVRHGDDRLCSDRTAFVIAIVFGGLAFALLLKSLFGAPRPPESLHAIEVSDDGFPSGHTMVATIGWGALAWWILDESRALGVVVVATAVALVAFSRLVLGVHFLADVLASVVFAVSYLAAAAWVTRGRPMHAFALAFVLALVTTLASGGETRAMLALVGTVIVPFGWQFVESRPVRDGLVRVAGRQEHS